MSVEIEESIYRLIPQVEPPKEKLPLYRSIHAEQSAVKKGVKSGALFGPKSAKKVTPSEFLKRTSVDPAKTTPRPEKGSFSYGARNKAPLPSKAELSTPLVSAREPKDFVKENALRNIIAVARSPQSDSVDYRSKEDYGRVPAYLTQVKADLEKEQQSMREIEAQRREAQDKNKLKLLPPQEKEELLASLKAKYSEVTKEYQGMTHLTVLDTPSKLRRKEDLESRLVQLEKSIEKLSKAYVFVEDE